MNNNYPFDFEDETDLFSDIFDIIPDHTTTDYTITDHTTTENVGTDTTSLTPPAEKLTVPRLFLAVNKQHFGRGLKSIDLLILSQIEEFQRNNHSCYISDKQLSEMFGESESTIKRSIAKMEKLNIVNRRTSFIKGNQHGNRQRTMSANPPEQWNDQNGLLEQAADDTERSDSLMEGSDSANGELTSAVCKVHNEPIKDKLKYNLTDNIKDNITIIEFILQKFKEKKKYRQIMDAVASEFGITLSFEQVRDVIDAREECKKQIEYQKHIQKEEKQKQYWREVSLSKIPEALEYLEEHNIYTNAEEIKTAYIKIQDSTYASKWSVDDLFAEEYHDLVVECQTFDEYTDAIHRRKDEIYAW